MKGVTHVSASSTSKFIECPAHWLAAYDDERSFNTRSDWTDAGVIVHSALERWRNPVNGFDQQSFQDLESCYYHVCRELKLVETLEVFKRGLDLIRKAFEIDSTNKHVPMNLAVTMAVEQSIDGYQPEGWIRPAKGSIDRLAIIRKPDESWKIIIVVEDYKTGRAKSWTELVEDDPQPSIYLAWTRDILAPHLVTQVDPLSGKPYEIERIVLLWSYIDQGFAIPINEVDIDLVEFKEYLSNIIVQMVNMKEGYEKLTDAIANAMAREDTEKIKNCQNALAEFLGGVERVNDHCSWCPRKRVCRNFNRQMQQEIVVDLTTTDMDAFMRRRAEAAAISKAAEEARKSYDRQFNALLEQQNLTEMVADGKLWKSISIKADHHSPVVVAEMLGTDFVLNAAKITKDAVESELARRAQFDPVKAAELREALEKRIIPDFGGRSVRSSKLPPAKKKAST